MKKLIASVAAGAMMLVGASQALAAFADLNLIRVFYTKETNLQVGHDILTMNLDDWKDPATTPINLVVGGGPQAFSPSILGVSSFSTIQVAYYAKNSSTADAWLTHDFPTGGKIESGAKWNGFSANTNKTYTGFSMASGSSFPLSSVFGYYFTHNSNMPTQEGRFSAIYSTIGLGEVNLADLNPGGIGYVDQYLYFFDTPNTMHSPGKMVAVIRTMADGTTVINPSAVPIPASVLLLGSGLLGLVGVRRKTRI